MVSWSGDCSVIFAERKVRTPQGRIIGNADQPKAGKVPQKTDRHVHHLGFGRLAKLI